jgi:hypothetical protein
MGSLGGDDSEEWTGEVSQEDVDLDTLTLAERIEHVRWYSDTPATHLLEITDELADGVEDRDIGERLTFAGLVTSLRVVAYVPRALSALEPDADSPWVRLLMAELLWVEGRMNVVDALIRGELKVLRGLEQNLQGRWLRLAARRGARLLAPVGEALTGSAVLEGTVIEADLGAPLDEDRRCAFAAEISTQARMDPKRARRCVDLLADRTAAGAGFRSQVVQWYAFDTYNSRLLTRIVDDALAATSQRRGYSAIRLGDGEAQVLAGVMPDVTGVLGVAPNKEWNELEDDEYAAFRERMAESIRGADVVGVPDLVQCLTGPVGYSEVGVTCVEVGVPEERIVPGGCDLGWALEISGQVDRLLERCTGIIGPIDPRDLRRVSPDVTLNWLAVPGELLYYYDEGGLATSHWSRFESIVAHDYQPGQLWLVGAGVLGKVYCDAIKRAGAVAIDVGSVLDVWAGRQDTRGTVREQLWVTTPYIREPR